MRGKGQGMAGIGCCIIPQFAKVLLVNATLNQAPLMPFLVMAILSTLSIPFCIFSYLLHQFFLFLNFIGNSQEKSLFMYKNKLQDNV